MGDWFEKEQLHFAAQDGDLRKVKELIELGFPVSEFDELGNTALHYAAGGEHTEVVRFLIESGADVNAHDKRVAGNTPLREVASNCSFQMANILIDAGADPTIPGWMQITALHKARERKREEGRRVYRLLEAAANRFRKGGSRETKGTGNSR